MKAVNMSNDWRARARRPDEALELIKSGMRVFVHEAAATPAPLLEALARRRDVEDLRLFHCFVSGSRRLYDFVNDNPFIEFHPCDRTNDTAHIRRNDRVVAINSAIEIDISGQVCADSIGFRIYSGIGGRWISSEARAGQRVIIAGHGNSPVRGRWSSILTGLRTTRSLALTFLRESHSYANATMTSSRFAVFASAHQKRLPTPPRRLPVSYVNRLNAKTTDRRTIWNSRDKFAVRMA
jgi:hypothetical protein